MLAALAACSADSPESYSARSPCAALTLTITGASSAQRDGIAAAIALWQDRGVSAFEAPAGAADAAADALEIRFDAAAATFHGIYDPAADRVLINRDLGAATLGIVIAHELGHVFGLVHVSPDARRSLMNPGNLSTPPTDDDQRTLEALWGRCRAD
jgi:hypothetical protein